MNKNIINKEESNNFEQLVFEKIRKRKIKKKLLIYACSLFLVVTSFSIFLTVHFSNLSYKNKNFQAKYEKPDITESIHLTDKFYLPTSKSNSHYLIQEVSYQESPNQI